MLGGRANDRRVLQLRHDATRREQRAMTCHNRFTSPADGRLTRLEAQRGCGLSPIRNPSFAFVLS